jgi:hypothetical protein
MVASCGQAGNGKEMDTSLESAKSKVMSLEQEIVQLLPQDAVTSTWANDSSSLLRCEGERKKWAGDAVAELMPGVDRDGFLDEVAASMSGRTGWKVSEDTTPDGERSLELLHEDGTHVLVSFEESPESLRIVGYSACFDLPEYEYGEKY